jgi:transcriptional regulator with XRE-family HTH domain
MEPLPVVFGRRVRELRRAKGMTQEQLAHAAKMDYKHVGAIERGVKSSSFQAVERLARALDVPYYQLFISKNRVGVDVEREINVLIRSADRLTSVKFTEFLRALRAAVRRLGDS